MSLHPINEKVYGRTALIECQSDSLPELNKVISCLQNWGVVSIWRM